MNWLNKENDSVYIFLSLSVYVIKKSDFKVINKLNSDAIRVETPVTSWPPK